MGEKYCEKNRVLTFCELCFFLKQEKTESAKSKDIFHSISPHAWDSVFPELKCSDYSKTKFLLFAGAMVLDTH